MSRHKQSLHCSCQLGSEPEKGDHEEPRHGDMNTAYTHHLPLVTSFVRSWTRGQGVSWDAFFERGQRSLTVHHPSTYSLTLLLTPNFHPSSSRNKINIEFIKNMFWHLLRGSGRGLINASDVWTAKYWTVTPGFCIFTATRGEQR